MKTARRKKYRIKSKGRFLVSMIIMLSLIVSSFNFLFGNNVLALEKTTYTEFEICYGDTLWDIANNYKSDDTDTRKAVYEICKVNDITASDLTPGMIIMIPDKL